MTQRARALGVVIFGAAVRPDGRPSATLARRIACGAAAASRWPEATILCSGAAGLSGPSEASVMRRGLLARGIAPARIRMDETSRDTLQSAVVAARMLRCEGLAGWVVCSDSYHLPRIRLLLRLLGAPSRAGPVARGQGGVPFWNWLYMRFRELVAIPYDAALVLLQRRRFTAD